MINLLQPLQDLVREFARGAADAVRAALRRVALIGVALLIAMPGVAFLIFAAFLGLRDLFGPGLAALTMGAALLALAAGVLLIATRTALPAPPSAPAPQPTAPDPTPSPGPADAATMAVFTAAFLLGRHLADRRGPTDNS